MVVKRVSVGELTGETVLTREFFGRKVLRAVQRDEQLLVQNAPWVQSAQEIMQHDERKV